MFTNWKIGKKVSGVKKCNAVSADIWSPKNFENDSDMLDENDFKGSNCKGTHDLDGHTWYLRVQIMESCAMTPFMADVAAGADIVQVLGLVRHCMEL